MEGWYTGLGLGKTGMMTACGSVYRSTMSATSSVTVVEGLLNQIERKS